MDWSGTAKLETGMKNKNGKQTRKIHMDLDSALYSDRMYTSNITSCPAEKKNRTVNDVFEILGK